MIERDLRITNNLVINVYVLEGKEFVSTDSVFGKDYPDCYLKVKLGRQVKNDSDKVVMNDENPGFYRWF